MTEDIKLVCTKKRKTVSDENSIQKRRRHTKNENSVFSQIENGMKSVVKSEAVLLQELEKQLFKEINDMSNALTESQRHLSELRMESDELANRISKKKYLPQNEPKLVFDSVEFERMFEHVNHPISVVQFPNGRLIGRNRAFRELLVEAGTQDGEYASDVLEMENKIEQRRIYDECVRKQQTNPSRNPQIPVLSFTSTGQLKDKQNRLTTTVLPYHCSIICTKDLQPKYSVVSMFQVGQIPYGYPMENLFSIEM